MPYGSPHIRSCLCSIPFQHVIVAVDLFGILRIAPGIRMRSLHTTAAFCLQLLLGERNLQSKELQCCVIIAGSLSGITSCSAVIGITAFVFSIFSFPSVCVTPFLMICIFAFPAVVALSGKVAFCIIINEFPTVSQIRRSYDLESSGDYACYPDEFSG